MTSPPTEFHVPPPLHLPDFGDDDAFDINDDNLTQPPYVFSPDVIREEMAKYIPQLEETWDEAENPGSIGGSMSDLNESVSTLDIDTFTTPNGKRSPPVLELPLDSSLSAHFSQISLSTPAEDDHPHNFIRHNNINGSDDSEQFNSIAPNESSVKSSSLSSFPDPSQPEQLEISSPLPTPLSAPLPKRTFSPDIALPPPPNSSTTLASTSLSLPVIAYSGPGSSNGYLTEEPSGHRSRRSVGPSTFEKVRSKTRPLYLPPKPRNEDEKHLADWQQMMTQSRLTAEKRRKALQERRLNREKVIEDSLHIWEREILPDWRVVQRNAHLRKLWWNGIPSKLRAPLWEKVVGNELALSKDHYRTCLSRAKRALASGVFPQPTLELIEQDMLTTLPALHIFHKENGPLHADLKDMLCAWVVSRSDEGLGYTLGAAKIAAMLLINMPSQSAFIVMRNLLERHCMRSFFGGERSKDDVEAYYRIFDTLLADGMPKIYFNFKQHQISPSAYLPDWVVPLFLEHLPFEACARIWDVLLLEGDSFLYRASLAVLAVLESRLFFPEKRELLELLKGENRAAIEVAKRECRDLKGGKYEIYGVDEETLWNRIDSMDDWWKDSTWTRLIQRELPDL